MIVDKNSNNQDEEQRSTIISLKQQFEWHFIAWIMEMIEGQLVFPDKEFHKYFTPLKELVFKHLEIPQGLKIIDGYVVCECVADKD